MSIFFRRIRFVIYVSALIAGAVEVLRGDQVGVRVAMLIAVITVVWSAFADRFAKKPNSKT